MDKEDILIRKEDILDQAARNAHGDKPDDEYHTMDELYEYRMAYNIHAIHYWRDLGLPVGKAVRHSDGVVCFDGAFFIVWAELPTGQVTNHYKMEHFYKFDVPVYNRSPKWDGHTPQEALKRILECDTSTLPNIWTIENEEIPNIRRPGLEMDRW